MIQYQILQTNITGTIRQTVRRITNEILGVKGLTPAVLIEHKTKFNTRFSNYPYFQMVECPEPVHDNKTLYERLQEQKQKKQDEWDEQHQLSKYLVFFFQC